MCHQRAQAVAFRTFQKCGEPARKRVKNQPKTPLISLNRLKQWNKTWTSLVAAGKEYYA